MVKQGCKTEKPPHPTVPNHVIAVVRLFFYSVSLAENVSICGGRSNILKIKPAIVDLFDSLGAVETPCCYIYLCAVWWWGGSEWHRNFFTENYCLLLLETGLMRAVRLKLKLLKTNKEKLRTILSSNLTKFMCLNLTTPYTKVSFKLFLTFLWGPDSVAWTLQISPDLFVVVLKFLILREKKKVSDTLSSFSLPEYWHFVLVVGKSDSANPCNCTNL